MIKKNKKVWRLKKIHEAKKRHEKHVQPVEFSRVRFEGFV
jgi:hypothetical protein